MTPVVARGGTRTGATVPSGGPWGWWLTLRAVRRRYAEMFGKRPRLLASRRQSERIVHRKLFGRDPRLPALADKVAVKAFVAGRIGPRFVVPTLWAGDAEWLYSEIPHRLLVEPHLGVRRPGHGPRLERSVRQRRAAGRVRPAPATAVVRHDDLDGGAPGADFAFVRVDLYEIDGRPYFGELTFYPMSGHLPLHPTDTDLELGLLWRRPRRPRYPAAPVPHLVSGLDATPEKQPARVEAR